MQHRACPGGKDCVVMALRKRIWRIIRENKGRYIGVFILIFLGSFAFIIASGIGDTLAGMVGGFAEKNLQEDIMFGTDMPIEDIAALERKSGALIGAHRYLDAALPEGEIKLVTPCAKVNIPAVLSGRGLARLANPGEILLSPNLCNLRGLEIGGRIDINGKAFIIVGTAAIPNYTFIIKNVNDVLPPKGYGLGLISDGDMDAFPGAASVYSARFTNRDDINGQSNRLYSLVRESGYRPTEWVFAMNNNRIRMPWASITGAQTMGLPAAVSMFLLCGLIVGLMIWRMVKADGVVIGTLYAQGCRRREITRHYMLIPVLLPALAGLAGTLLALPCIGPAVLAMTAYYNVPVSGVLLSPPDIAIGILMPIAFMGIPSYLAVRKSLKKSAAELMRGDGQKAKINFLERGLRLERFKFSTKFQLREQVRSIPRLLFLLLGVSAASMLLMFGFTINNSMNAVLGGDLAGRYDFALEYSFKETQAGEVPEGAAPFGAIRCYPEGRESAEFYLMGIMPDSPHITLRGRQGGELPRDQINITYPLASRLGLEAGDTISFVNKLGGESYSLRIGGVVETYAEQFIYMPLDEFNRMTGQAPGSYTGLFSDRELDLDPGLLSGVKDLRNLDSAMGDLAGTMTAMVVFAVVFAGLIGAIIIFLVTSLLIGESRNTISMLKVFGYRGKEIARLILSSSTPAVVAGFCLGFPVMLAIGNTLYGYLGEMINLVLPMVVNPLHIVLSFAVIYAVYWLTRLLCGKKIGGISMSEALKAGTE